MKSLKDFQRVWANLAKARKEMFETIGKLQTQNTNLRDELDKMRDERERLRAENVQLKLLDRQMSEMGSLTSWPIGNGASSRR
jgi:hypothetical protein